MLKAVVYYYPQNGIGTFGHIGIKISFEEKDIPDRERVKNIIRPVSIISDFGEYSSEFERKKEARIAYRPIIYIRDGKYFIYGCKNDVWQETELINLSEDELLIVKNGFAQYSQDIEISSSSPLLNQVAQAHTRFKRTDYFFDWGGSYDFEDNEWRRGEPICIEMPESDKSWIDFINAVENRVGYRWYNNNDYASQPYHLLKNNCAHSVLQILYLAGYISEQPVCSYALTPCSVAKQACKIANNARALFRLKLTESLSVEQRNNPQHINRLIQNTLKRIGDELHFSSFFNKQYYQRDLQLISEINYDGTLDSIDRLLHASEVAGTKTAEELEQCIAILPPGVFLKLSIARLNKAADKLDERNFPEDAKISRKLARDLTNQVVAFESREINHETFAKNCSDLLEAPNTRSTLEKHRGYKQIFKNIALAIVSLVAVYLVAICINKAVNGFFLFFNETTLSRCSDMIKNEVHEYVTPNLNS